MSINFPSGLTNIRGEPLDSKAVVTSITERDAIPIAQRYRGMQVTVQNTGSTAPVVYWLATDDLTVWSVKESGGVDLTPAATNLLPHETLLSKNPNVTVFIPLTLIPGIELVRDVTQFVDDDGTLGVYRGTSPIPEPSAVISTVTISGVTSPNASIKHTVTLSWQDYNTMKQAGTLDPDTIYNVPDSQDDINSISASIINTGGIIASNPISESISGVSSTQSAINTETSNNIKNVNSVIPNLATQAFVNSSIQTMSANKVTFDAFGNPYPTRNDLITAGIFFNKGASYVPQENDYCTVLADETHDNSQCRYAFDGVQWNFQFLVNDTPFTNAQNLAINSGITAELVSQIQPMISFSLTEQAVPNVKWIDGKQVYQIVIQGSTHNLPSQFETVGTIANFDKLVKIEGYLVNSANSSIPSGFYNSSGDVSFSLSVNSAGVVQAYHSSNSFNNSPVVAIVQYTKVGG